jgi:adenosylcobinamide amidohydrolase
MMHIQTFYNGVKLYRGNKVIYGHFLEPHLVISTCRAKGGVEEGLEYVMNHQGCEPCNHRRHANIRDTEGYQCSICEPHDLPPERTATMGTAANMNHAAFVSKSYDELKVVAVVTGGVETNAGRAGDPASVLETPDGFDKLEPVKKIPGPGTINTMLFVSRPLTRAALTRTIMTATEAKTAALQELSVNSRYSDGLATGTGTDQIIVAAPDRKGYRLTWAGKHSKLGELIGLAVKEAVKETLAKQNSLTPLGQCSVKIHLERFGANRESLLAGISSHLDDGRAKLLSDNFSTILRDPLTVAAVAGLVHIRDKFSWGTLPHSCWPEIMAGATAQIACTISSRYDRMDFYRQKLCRTDKEQGNGPFLRLCCRAMALGFDDKWGEQP